MARHPARVPPREHVGEAVRAGDRYIAASPVLRVILLRAALFVFFASAIWALLPLTARSQLHLGCEDGEDAPVGAGADGEGEFEEDLLDAGLDGALGDEQAVGDGPVGQPFGDEREHLAFRSGELVERAA